ncbi:MAG: glycosyltransferase [Pseudanabaenaceae cyanobacterium]
MRISLCAIVRNEAHQLGRCLASVAPHVDEMIVVDTGSTDNTVAIAQGFGAQVYTFTWGDDFAAARNAALVQATGDWVLVVDADEELVVVNPGWREVLAPMTPKVLALSREEVGLPNWVGGFHPRLFRRLPGVHYEGRYHEQLRYPVPVPVEPWADVRLKHYGNTDPAAVRQKTLTRDIPILETMRQEGTLSLWLLDCLARNYDRTEQVDRADDCYQEAYRRLAPHLRSGEPPTDLFWVATVLQALSERAIAAGDWETARLCLSQGLRWCPNFPPLAFWAGIWLREVGLPLGAIAYFRQAIAWGQTGDYQRSEAFDPAYLDVHPACALGETYERLGQPAAARAAWEQALAANPTWEPAQAAIARLRD